MSEKQNKTEYERCKAKGLLGRLSLSVLKKFGTKEEIAARETPEEEAPEGLTDKEKESVEGVKEAIPQEE